MSSARSSATRWRSRSGWARTPAATSRSTSACAASETVVAARGTIARSAATNCARFTRRGASEPLLEELHEVERALGDAHPGILEGLNLLGRRSRRAGDDRAGVSHPAAGRRRLAGDEAD